jgi:ABC-2 type transport system permease protein
MLLRNLFLKTLRDLRGQILGWGLGLGLLGLLIAALYPAFQDQMSLMVDLLAGYPPTVTAFFGDMSEMGRWEGWLNIEFFSWIPPILAVFSVGAGTGLIAGEEEKGTLDLLLSHPIRRWRVVAEKFAALVAATLLICLMAGLFLIVGALMIGETASLDGLVLATLNVVPITLAGGTFALMASTLLRSRRLATMTAIFVIIGSWFVDSLGKVVDVLEPYRPFTLFHYYTGDVVMTRSLEWGDIGMLLGLTILFFVISLLAFQRRDIAV